MIPHGRMRIGVSSLTNTALLRASLMVLICKNLTANEVDSVISPPAMTISKSTDWINICIAMAVKISPLRKLSRYEFGILLLCARHQCIDFCSLSILNSGSPTNPIVNAGARVKPISRVSFSDIVSGSTIESNPPITSSAANQFLCTDTKVLKFIFQPIFVLRNG